MTTKQRIQNSRDAEEVHSANVTYNLSKHEISIYDRCFLPSPELLEKYSSIGIEPKEIFESYKRNQQHRQNMESKTLETVTKLDSRGQLFGFVITIIAFVTAVIAIFLGHELYALGAIVTALTPLILALQFRRKRKKQTQLIKPSLL